MPFQLSPTLKDLQLSEAISQDMFVACLLQQVPGLCQIFLGIAKRSINARKDKSYLLRPNNFHL